MSRAGQIMIEGLDLYAYHGHFAEEERLGQHFIIDLVLDCDLRASSFSDNLADTVDYGAVVALRDDDLLGAPLQTTRSGRARYSRSDLRRLSVCNRDQHCLAQARSAHSRPDGGRWH
ncbi:dihydroneopterin aldolase [Bradyrhizobium sp. 45]|uniref:dihydroneopterin aldolase n=1 Tax=Bradyrhizobium sp. 45 TaxID=1043587 RepID=UPI001FFA2BB8|nr:dihydroneopterin aldolase [Bradyrhizobium sp. 45]MCK1305799.1 dihydroneopterin aldolase [Bradyrhizobium sp. 45]